MAIYEFEGKRPQIGSGSFIFDSADVIGNVVLGEGVYVGPGACIRGDYGRIEIGDRTSIGDNCVIHARPDEICVIGKDVTIGHGAIIHNCTIGNFALVGMRAVVSDYAKLGVWAIVGEGAVVKNKSEIPDGKIAVGVPAKVIADVSDDVKKLWTGFKGVYTDLACRRYPEGLKRID